LQVDIFNDKNEVREIDVFEIYRDLAEELVKDVSENLKEQKEVKENVKKNKTKKSKINDEMNVEEKNSESFDSKGKKPRFANDNEESDDETEEGRSKNRSKDEDNGKEKTKKVPEKLLDTRKEKPTIYVSKIENEHIKPPIFNYVDDFFVALCSTHPLSNYLSGEVNQNIGFNEEGGEKEITNTTQDNELCPEDGNNNNVDVNVDDKVNGVNDEFPCEDLDDETNVVNDIDNPDEGDSSTFTFSSSSPSSVFSSFMLSVLSLYPQKYKRPTTVQLLSFLHSFHSFFVTSKFSSSSSSSSSFDPNIPFSFLSSYTRPNHVSTFHSFPDHFHLSHNVLSSSSPTFLSFSTAPSGSSLSSSFPPSVIHPRIITKEVTLFQSSLTSVSSVGLKQMKDVEEDKVDEEYSFPSFSSLAVCLCETRSDLLRCLIVGSDEYVFFFVL
jgi:hypothetical protein